MATQEFNPLDYGAIPINDFNPFDYGAVSVEEKQPGFAQGLVQDVAKPFLRLGATARGKELNAGYLGKAQPFQPIIKEGGIFTPPGQRFGLQQPINFKGLGEVAGAGLQIASNIPFARGVTIPAQLGYRRLFGTGLKTGIKEGTFGGGLFAGGRAIEQGKTPQEVALETAIGTGAGALGGGILGGTLAAGGVATRRLLQSAASKVSDVIKLGVDKGIKPYFGKIPTQALRDKYYKAADLAVRTIHKLKTVFIDEDGNPVQRNPQTRQELLEGINQGKDFIFSQYDQLARQAGQVARQTKEFFGVDNIISKLQGVARSRAYNPQIRAYAKSLIPDIQELAGRSPKIIQERIKDLNTSLEGFFSGRVDKGKARVDASVGVLLRENLDRFITKLTDETYQPLKNQYGALKTIEKDVARQVAVELRRTKAGLIDFTDIFTGADLFSGVITGNPTLVVKGLVGRGTKEIIKYLNNPNRYIKNMFQVLEKSEIPRRFFRGGP